MAAVLPFMETEDFHFPEELGTSESLNGLGAKKPDRSKMTPEQIKELEALELAAANRELTELLWLRAGLHQSLQGYGFKLVLDGRSIKIKLTKDAKELEAIPSNLVPWSGLSSEIKEGVKLFSTNSKMRCPTFDLPAGALTLGGSCPAAGPAQTTSLGTGTGTKGGLIKLNARDEKVLVVTPDVHYDLARSVCLNCYASGTAYGKTVIQLTEMLHMMVALSAVKHARMGDAFVEAVVWQIPNLPFDADTVEGQKEGKRETIDLMNSKYRARNGNPQRMVRVHSSGDFFNQEYAALWLRIAQRLWTAHGDEFMLWAPTRTHVIPTFRQWWGDREKEGSIPPNFIIRPSAYGIGDFAPASPGLAAGTSVLVPDDAAASIGIKFDHQCGVYDLDENKKVENTCVAARDPNGDPGCRACWVRGNDSKYGTALRVNYVAH